LDWDEQNAKKSQYGVEAGGHRRQFAEGGAFFVAELTHNINSIRRL